MYLLNTLRVLFVIFAFLVGLGIEKTFTDLMPQQGLFPLLMAALAACMVTVEVVFQKRYLAGLVAVFIGLVLGLGATFIATSLLERFVEKEYYKRFIEPLGPMITLFLCYLTVTIVFQTRDRLRFVIPYVAFSNQGRKRGGLILDSSVFVDGRIVELCHTSLLADDLIVPEFVIHELQALADSADAMKRNRGRRGLDVLSKLQHNPRLIMHVEAQDYPELTGVDAKLVRLARDRDALVLTGDQNLAKVARVEGVEAILLQEVAASLKPLVTPGERLHVKLLRPGEDRDQGVGYLEDGTMVVVEGGRGGLGQEVEIEVLRLLSTQAGRIVFARPTVPLPPAGHDSDKSLKAAGRPEPARIPEALGDSSTSRSA